VIAQVVDFVSSWDFWVWFGFFGQFLFFMRFVVQWLATEKAKKIVIPVAFWYFSIGGGAILAVYAIVQRDVVFSTGQILSLAIYARNLFLHYRHRDTDAVVG
jgi:lipid-A-disaccharide synthase-like uncharacterized protein